MHERQITFLVRNIVINPQSEDQRLKKYECCALQ